MFLNDSFFHMSTSDVLIHIHLSLVCTYEVCFHSNIIIGYIVKKITVVGASAVVTVLYNTAAFWCKLPH